MLLNLNRNRNNFMLYYVMQCSIVVCCVVSCCIIFQTQLSIIIKPNNQQNGNFIYVHIIYMFVFIHCYVHIQNCIQIYITTYIRSLTQSRVEFTRGRTCHAVRTYRGSERFKLQAVSAVDFFCESYPQADIGSVRLRNPQLYFNSLPFYSLSLHLFFPFLHLVIFLLSLSYPSYLLFLLSSFSFVTPLPCPVTSPFLSTYHSPIIRFVFGTETCLPVRTLQDAGEMLFKSDTSWLNARHAGEVSTVRVLLRCTPYVCRLYYVIMF